MGLILIGSFSSGGGGSSVPDKNFVWVQSTPLASWNITHNLGKYPAVQVFDSFDNEVFADITNTGLNTTIITFSVPFSGKAVFN